MGHADHPADVSGNVIRPDEAHIFRIVVIVAEIGNPVGILNERPLQGVRPETAAVIHNPVPHLIGQIQALSVLFQHIHDAEALLIVLEMAVYLCQRLLSHMTEGRMSQVMAETDGFHQVLIETERPGHGPPDLGDLQGVGHARPVMVAHGRDIDLRLVFQPPESIAVQNPVPVPLEIHAERVLLLLSLPRCLCGRKSTAAQKGKFSFFIVFPGIHTIPPSE